MPFTMTHANFIITIDNKISYYKVAVIFESIKIILSFGIGMFVGIITTCEIKSKINKFKNRKEDE